MRVPHELSHGRWALYMPQLGMPQIEMDRAELKLPCYAPRYSPGESCPNPG
ncbi:hypothetical protein BS78_04G143200 [Paspalum vaginatum]|nr:hypothetical protein BS78_04G143200 [Paspalum vaginatum]